jgi:hypothetical protein
MKNFILSLIILGPTFFSYKSYSNDDLGHYLIKGLDTILSNIDLSPEFKSSFKSIVVENINCSSANGSFYRIAFLTNFTSKTREIGDGCQNISFKEYFSEEIKHPFLMVRRSAISPVVLGKFNEKKATYYRSKDERPCFTTSDTQNFNASNISYDISKDELSIGTTCNQSNQVLANLKKQAYLSILRSSALSQHCYVDNRNSDDVPCYNAILNNLLPSYLDLVEDTYELDKEVIRGINQAKKMIKTMSEGIK